MGVVDDALFDQEGLQDLQRQVVHVRRVDLGVVLVGHLRPPRLDDLHVLADRRAQVLLDFADLLLHVLADFMQQPLLLQIVAQHFRPDVIFVCHGGHAISLDSDVPPHGLHEGLRQGVEVGVRLRNHLRHLVGCLELADVLPARAHVRALLGKRHPGLLPALLGRERRRLVCARRKRRTQSGLRVLRGLSGAEVRWRLLDGSDTELLADLPHGLAHEGQFLERPLQGAHLVFVGHFGLRLLDESL